MPQPSVCAACARYVQRRSQRKRKLVFAAALLAVAGAATLALAMQPDPAPFVPPPAPTLEDFKRERVTRTPCGEDVVVDLMDYLLSEHRFEHALAFGREVVLRCGQLRSMQPRIMNSLRGLRRWGEAVAFASALIALEPRGVEFWRWRAEAYGEQGRPLLAIADYRQAMAIWPLDGNALWPLEVVAHNAGLLCAAEHAKRYRASTAWWDYTQIGGCGAERGRGSGHLRDAVRVPARIGPASSQLEVDSDAGFTVISSALARRAGVIPMQDRMTALLRGRLVSGHLARVPRLVVGTLSARDVDVLVTDELAPGDDGAIGISFLWRFDFRRDGYHGFALTPPPS